MDEINAYIAIWENRIEEIKETGNCSNGNLAYPELYFQGQSKKHSPDEMIEFCNKQIQILNERKEEEDL